MSNAQAGERFLSPDELRERAEDWQMSARSKEGGGEIGNLAGFSDCYVYTADRIEEPVSLDGSSIDKVHEQSFIEYISSLINLRGGAEEMKRRGEKIKVLDVGGGMGLYAKQLRDRFGECIRVYTTGLSKKTARESRKMILTEEERNKAAGMVSLNRKQMGEERKGVLSNLSGRLHPDDLKWRSILQLTRNWKNKDGELDLLLDTFGEAEYSIEDVAGLKQYVEAVVDKLKRGGMASIKITATSLWSLAIKAVESGSLKLVGRDVSLGMETMLSSWFVGRGIRVQVKSNGLIKIYRDAIKEN